MGDRAARPDRLNGMFAFAIWDGRQLFAARDRMGEKPFYYTRYAGAFYFASEIKSLLTQVPAGPSIPPDFLVFENTLSDETLFAGVMLLPPAHFLLVRDGRGRRASILGAPRPRRRGNHRGVRHP